MQTKHLKAKRKRKPKKLISCSSDCNSWHNLPCDCSAAERNGVKISKGGWS